MTCQNPVQSPVVSVLIPAYRHAAFIEEAVRSALDQNGGIVVEVIVVNDGSPDHTAAVLESLVRQGLVRYVEQGNQGQGRARNVAASLARGEYLAFLDDDDAFLPGKLQSQLQALKDSPDAVMVWGSAIDFDGHPIPVDPLQAAKWQGNRVIDVCIIRSPGQTLFSRDAFERVGGFDESLWGTDDFDLYIRLAQLGRFIFQPDPVLKYRLHPNNASRDTARMKENEQKLRRKHAGTVEQRVTSKEAARNPEETYADWVWLASFYDLEKRYSESRRCYLAAMRSCPSKFFAGRVWRRGLASLTPNALLRQCRHLRSGFRDGTTVSSLELERT